MADIAPRLVELSAGKLHSLHQRLHKSELTPEVLEVHHLVINEALRRGLMRVEEDAWDRYEIEIDYLENVDISNFSESLPEDAVTNLVSKMGSSIGNVRTVLTVNGYELRIEQPKEEPINKRLPEIQSFSKEKNYAPPKGVRVAARRAVEWISEGKAGDGFTSVGRMRAQQLSAGENISLATLKRMKSFFSRHEVDKDALGFSEGEKGYPSPGRVAWDAWGGNAGFSWAESEVAQAENAVTKHLPGQHDQKSHAGDYARKISDEIAAGGHPVVAPEDISALFGGMAKLTSHPDITELKVKGTLLFGDEGMGIARSDMPQIPTSARDKFLADIEKDNGITFEKEKVDPTTLKPIQKEVSGSRAGAIYEKFAEKGKIPKDERILISKDGFVVDGHHTWAASVAFSFDNPGTELPVYRLSVNADEALKVSRDYAKANGYESKAIDDNAKYSDGKEIKKSDVFKHGEGDQKPHGNWAHGGGDSAIPALAPDKEPEAKWSPEAVAKARAIREKALAVEPKITELMKTIQKNSGGEFVQLNERVKSTNSLASKIDREAVSEFDGDRSRAADAVSDAVRYTLKVGDENYAQALDSTTKALEASGFTLRVKNFWQSGDPYDGINIKARKDGIEVEVQLHTRSSFAHKEGEGGTHPIYKAYQTELNDTTRQTMWNQMIDIAKGVTRPANYGAILATGTLILQKFQTAQEAGLIKSTPVDIMSPERTGK